MNEIKHEDEMTDEEFSEVLAHHITNSEDRCACGGSVIFPLKPDYSRIPLHVKKMNDEIRARHGIMPRWKHEYQ